MERWVLIGILMEDGSNGIAIGLGIGGRSEISVDSPVGRARGIMPLGRRLDVRRLRIEPQCSVTVRGDD